MILTLAEFALLLLLSAGGLVLLTSLLSWMQRGHVEKRALKQRVICRLCLHAFENPDQDAIIECPLCGVANEGRRS